MNVAVRVARTLPSVVDVYVDIPGISHAVTRHGVRDSPNCRVVDAVGELVPTAPSHGRCPSETVVANRMQRRRLDTGGKGALALRYPVRDHYRAVPFGVHLHELQFVSSQLAP